MPHCFVQQQYLWNIAIREMELLRVVMDIHNSILSILNAITDVYNSIMDI